MSAYCLSAPGHPEHGPYHQFEYGFPQREEAVLFERLVLEINQAGLAWLTVLRKRAGLRRAYAGFQVEAVAGFGAAERARLLADAGIIRNRRKIEAAIHNAGVVLALRDSHGGFAGWLDAQHPASLADWVRTFRRRFVFVGPEIVNEFLLSLGYLPGAHRPDCPVYARTLAASPPWRAG